MGQMLLEVFRKFKSQLTLSLREHRLKSIFFNHELFGHYWQAYTTGRRTLLAGVHYWQAYTTGRRALLAGYA